MNGKIGTNTIAFSLTENLPKVKKSPVLSKEAKHRLNIIDYYFMKSIKYSLNNKPNKQVTARHFGVSLSFVKKWLKRYKSYDLTSLESKSRKPHKVKRAIYPLGFVSAIKKIRLDNPYYGALKIHAILKRDYDFEYCYSPATIGRIIKKYNLFFRSDINKRKKLCKKRQKVVKRIKSNFHKEQTKPIIEFDMKHIRLRGGRKLYGFVGIDTFTKQCVITVDACSSSKNALKCIQKIVDTFGREVIILNDNGSENFGQVYDYLKTNSIEQYFARPNTPKDKPFVERLIGTFQRECLDYSYENLTKEELENVTNIWVNKYHYHRPHQTLEYLSPSDFCEKLNKPAIPVEPITTKHLFG